MASRAARHTDRSGGRAARGLKRGSRLTQGSANLLRLRMSKRHPLDGLTDEIRDHIEREIQENVERGTTPAEARRQAMLKFGNIALAQEDTRAVWVWRWLDETRQDLRYAVRSLRRNPAFASVVILTLALGIGANTAIFSLVDAVLLRLLPVERPQELVFLESAGSDGSGGGAPPYPVFERFRNETSAFTGIAAFAADESRVVVDGVVEQVFGQVASGNYFELLGLRPILGRLMTMDDERLNPPVAVIGYGYWQRRFDGDPRAIGRIIVWGNRVFTIVGVTPPEFWGLGPGRQVDLTVPITQVDGRRTDVQTWGWYDMVARLRPGAIIEQATAQTDTILQSFLSDHEGSTVLRRNDHMALVPASRGADGLRTRFSKPLYALTLAAAIVLLISCVNLGNLLLARGTTRAREFAIRLATGAGSRRLVKQLLTETLLLCLVGAAAGLLVAHVMINGLTGFFAVGRNPIVLDIQYDWRRTLFATGVALVAGLFTGLWPAARALRTDPQTAIKDGDRRIAGSSRLAMAGRFMVVSQTALSLVLVVSALIFVKTMVSLRAVDLGFSDSRVLTMSLIPDFQGETAVEARTQFWTQVLDRVRGLTGVRAASLSVLTPLSGRDTGRRIDVAGFQPRTERDRSIHLNHISEDYFQTFGIELVAGRAFTPRDTNGAPRVVVVNEAAVKFYFAGRSPIGETIQFQNSGAYQVVGIVRDHKHRNVREQAPPFAFVPLWQPIDPVSRITLAISSDQPSSPMARAVTQEVQSIHANTLVSDVIDVEEQIDATLISERLLSALATGFAALALGLAAIGLYGILSYSVAQRKAEFGVRIALGATRSRVASDLLRTVLLQVAVGVGIGLPAALATGRAVEGLLFGVTPAEPWYYLFSAAVLAVVACVAAWLPARRAAHIDPVAVMRES